MFFLLWDVDETLCGRRAIGWRQPLYYASTPAGRAVHERDQDRCTGGHAAGRTRPRGRPISARGLRSFGTRTFWEASRRAEGAIR